MNNLKIRLKIILIVLILGAVALGGAVFSGVSMKSVDTAYSELLDGESKALVKNVRGSRRVQEFATSAYSLAFETTSEGNAAALKVTQEASAAALAAIAEAGTLAPQFADRFNDLQSQAKTVFAQCEPLLQKAAATTNAQESVDIGAQIKRDCEPGLSVLIRKQIGVTELLQKDVDKVSDELTASTHRTIALSIGSLIVALIVVVAFAVWISVVKISRPLTVVVDILNRLGRNDLEVSVPLSQASDEIGELVRASGQLRQSLVRAREIEVAAAQQKEDAERQRKQEMHKMADGFEQSVQGCVAAVSSNAGQMQSLATSLSAMAEQTSRQSAAVAAASNQATSNVQTVATAAEELSASIQEIGRQMDRSAKVAEAAAHEARDADTAMKGLAEMSVRIGEVVNLINDIASQTNLLALNATIEAARAGDAGKGFAVVANEVKHLANQTARATEDISQQVSSVQHAANEAVQAIGGIVVRVEEINEIASAIAASVEEQTAATSEIARNVQQAARGTQDVSDNIIGVSGAAKETGDSAQQVLSSAEQLSKEAGNLRNQVTTFLSTVRAA